MSECYGYESDEGCVVYEKRNELFNIKDEYRGNSVEENKELTKSMGHQDVILALNPACWHNIGSMIRTAFLFGFSKFIVLGRSQYDKRTAVGTHHYMDIEKINIMEGNHNEHFSPEKMISYLEAYEDQYHFIFIEQCMTGLYKANKQEDESYSKEKDESYKGTNIQGNNESYKGTNGQKEKNEIEQGVHSVFLQDFKYNLSTVPSEAHKKKMFIFGSESDGIPKQVMEHFRSKHFIVEIPQHGIGRSHNIASALSIVLWEFYRDSF